MKKLLFILFFPITVPVYLLIKFFGWIKDSFIPFVQYDVVPFVNTHIVSKLRSYAKYKAEQMQEKETVSYTDLQDDAQPTINIQPDGDIYIKQVVDETPQVQKTEILDIHEDVAPLNCDNMQTFTESASDCAKENKQTIDLDSFPQNNTPNIHSAISEHPPIDYSQIMAVGRTSVDALYLGALAVAAYEQIISFDLLQYRLKFEDEIGEDLFNALVENEAIAPLWNGTYRSRYSENEFNLILLHYKENMDFEEKHGFSLSETNTLFRKYSMQYDDIEYKKDSKIVSIFTKKWREICRREFIALDFETTGLNYKQDRIIEVAAIKYVDGIETDKMVTLVNPLRHIHSDATAINHITDDMVADAPTERLIIPQLIEFLGNSLIVGHNVNFDLSFLEVAAQRYGYNVKYNYIDTLSVSKNLFKGLPNYKLGTVANFLHIDTGNLHRAEADVRICAEIISIALNSLTDE